MIKLRTSDYVVYTIALIGFLYALIGGNLVFASIFVTLAFLYNSISLFGYCLIISMILSSRSMFDLLYVALIGYYVYQNWIEGRKPLDYVSVGNLPSYHQQYYANVFLVIVGLNILIQVMASGSLQIAFSGIFLITMLTSTFKIFSSWMISKRVYEASYFFIGYLVLSTISSIMLTNNFDIYQLNIFLIIEFSLMFVISIMYIIRHK